MSPRIGAFVAGVALAVAPAASAVTLQTAYLNPFPSQSVQCWVTNTGTKPLEVAVSFVDRFGSVITPILDNCNAAPLSPGWSCQMALDNATGGRCVVEARKGKVKAVGYILDNAGGSPSTVLEATK